MCQTGGGCTVADPAPVATVTLPKSGGTPKRARGRPPTMKIPMTVAEWDEVPADKLDETIEAAKKVSEGLSYATIVALSRDNRPGRRTETTTGPPRATDDAARVLFAEEAGETQGPGHTQPQGALVTQTQDEETAKAKDPNRPRTLSELVARGPYSVDQYDDLVTEFGEEALRK